MSIVRSSRSGVPTTSHARGCAAGSILIEILVAIVLLCIAIVPLASAMDEAREQVERARFQNQSAMSTSTIAWTREAWVWGPRLTSAEWRPGPGLHLDVGQGKGSEVMVGLWIDGWFAGEWQPDASGRIVVQGPTVAGHVGAEMVVRVRSPGKHWGPPWRSLVPDHSGRVAGGLVWGREVAAGSTAEDQTVLHPPTEGVPLFEVSDPGLTLRVDGAGPPIFVGNIAGNECVAGLNDIEQAWKVEENRALDLYF
jgi:hypothetical protein